MTVPGAESRFDPWAVLTAFQRGRLGQSKLNGSGSRL